MPQPKKPSKAGRPPLPRGSAKGVMLRVRITPDELLAVEAAAKATEKTVSEWIRDLVRNAVAR